MSAAMSRAPGGTTSAAMTGARFAPDQRALDRDQRRIAVALAIFWLSCRCSSTRSATLHRQLDESVTSAGLRRDGARAEHRRRLRRPARPRLRGVLRDRRVHDRLVRVRASSTSTTEGHPRRSSSDFAAEPAGHPPQLPLRHRHRGGVHRAVSGSILGLPTLRLRGDYIAIVTLAFGEIIAASRSTATRVDARRLHAHQRPPGHHPGRQPSTCPGLDDVHPRSTSGPGTGSRSACVLVVLFVNFRLRDSRLGRAWIAIREDEVAAASWACRSSRRS